MERLKMISNAFEEGAWIPVKYTARGEDLSPGFELSGIATGAKFMAITLDDLSHPIIPNYNHWVIWNIPVQSVIPEGIPHGKTVKKLGGAVQGKAYGNNCYKGPKPPLASIHTYVFTIYILDQKLELRSNGRKRDLLSKMEGHILQTASISGKYQSHRSHGF